MKTRSLGHSARLMMPALVAAIVMGCGSAAPSPSPSLPPSPSRATAGTACAARSSVVLRWFVGLGTGVQPDQIAAEKEFVLRHNAACRNLYIQLEIVPTASAHDVLAMEIAAGNAPDIVGPVGLRGLSGLGGSFADLAPLAAKHGTDLTGIEPALFDLLKDRDGAQIGFPYTFYPGYIFYNKDLFTKAGLPDLPHKVGETYQGKEWSWETLRQVAGLLTLDVNGRNSTEAGFDANKIVQYGFDFDQWAGAGQIASSFGGGTLLAPDGRTAQIPAAWSYGWKWYYDSMSRNVSPAYRHCAIEPWLCPPPLQQGKLATAASWLWAMPAYGSVKDGKSLARFRSWDIAVMPSYQGKTSSPMDLDTFAISKSSTRPDDAFEALAAIMADPKLMATYGGVPARKSLQTGYFASMDAKLAPIFPGNKVDWSVISEMAKHPALRSQDADVPNATKVASLYNTFLAKVQSERGLNMDAELEKFRRAIQQAFDEALSSPSQPPA